MTTTTDYHGRPALVEILGVNVELTSKICTLYALYIKSRRSDSFTSLSVLKCSAGHRRSVVRVDETSWSDSRESSAEPVRLVVEKGKEKERKTDARYDVLTTAVEGSRKAQTNEGTALARETKKEQNANWSSFSCTFNNVLSYNGREFLRFFLPVIRRFKS